MQSPGAYALVNAMKNNPESTLIEVELTVRRKDRKETSSPEQKHFSSRFDLISNYYGVRYSVNGI